MEILKPFFRKRHPAAPPAWLRWTVVVFAVLAIGTEAPAEPRAVDEYELKAVFLFNFARFIAWPDSAFANDDAPVVIGVVGSDPFGDRLDQAIKGEKVERHPIVARRLKWHDDLTDCHILFISASETSRAQTILSRVKGRSILTVSDMPNFAATGGMIGFVDDGQRIRLQINLVSARSASLTVSSKLLRPSEVIGPDSGQLFRGPLSAPAFAGREVFDLPPAKPPEPPSVS